MTDTQSNDKWIVYAIWTTKTLLGRTKVDLVHMEFQDRPAALSWIHLGMTSNTFHPVAMRNRDDVWSAEDILEMFGVVFPNGPCWDHGMPSPWCRCGESA